MRRLHTEMVTLSPSGVAIEGVRQVRAKDLTALRRIVKAAEEVTSWCYVHQNRTSLAKMYTLIEALEAFNKMDTHL